MAAARFGGDALPVLDAHAWDSLVALNKGEAPGLAARADDGGIGDVGHPPRRLQEACDLGDTFTVSSTLYPSSSGCYSPYDPADLYTFVTSAVDRIILPLELFTGEYAGVVRKAPQMGAPGRFPLCSSLRCGRFISPFSLSLICPVVSPLCTAIRRRFAARVSLYSQLNCLRSSLSVEHFRIGPGYP